MPSEDEQYEVYSAIVKKMKGKSITVRTVDLGVDKNPRWFGQNSTPNGSLNPALGLTGIPPVPRRAGHVPHPNARPSSAPPPTAPCA